MSTPCAQPEFKALQPCVTAGPSAGAPEPGPEMEQLIGDDIEACESSKQHRNVWKYALVGACVVALAVVAVIAKSMSPQAAIEKSMSHKSITSLAAQETKVTIVTLETRGLPYIQRLENALDDVKSPNAPSRLTIPVVNIGIGEKWDGYKTKVILFAKYLHSKVAHGEGGELIAFMDGSDMAWGGCDTADFVAAYKRIVKASGAEIVFSAELACCEAYCFEIQDVPKWANKLANDCDLENGFWKPYAHKCVPHGKPFSYFKPMCGLKRTCSTFPSWSCDNPPAVKFLNSGLVMGPISKLLPMVDWVLENYKKWTSFGDQSVYGVYWMNNTKDVTLDYLGELSLSLSNFGAQKGDKTDIVKVDAKKGTVSTPAFNRTQCLLHGNGHGLALLRRIVGKLTTKKVPFEA